MAFIRSIDTIAEKWSTVTPQRSADYEDGVKNPRRSWSQATGAAEDSYKMGVQQAIAQGRFGAGVKRAGDEKWQAGAVEKGVSRWGPGVSLARDAYRSGFAPYQEAISRITLPPRYAKRDKRNLQRVNAVVDALIKTKERQLTVSG